MALTRTEAAVAYARTWNTLDISYLEGLLSDEVHYSSQNVLYELTTKLEVADYLSGKIETVRTAPHAQVFAELGCINWLRKQPCVVVAQGIREDVGAIVLFRVEDDKITQIDMCSVAPDPSTALRLGEYPD